MDAVRPAGTTVEVDVTSHDADSHLPEIARFFDRFSMLTDPVRV